MSSRIDYLTAHAQAMPDKLALIEDPLPGGAGQAIRWTYAELEREANRLAALLISLGISRKCPRDFTYPARVRYSPFSEWVNSWRTTTPKKLSIVSAPRMRRAMLPSG